MGKDLKVNGSRLGNTEPWLAANLSLLVPGAGQFYVERHVVGIAIAVVEGILFSLGVWQFCHPLGNTLLGAMLVVAFALGYVANVVHAHSEASRKNSREFEGSRRASKDPWLVVFLGHILPGLGHAYMRQWAFAAIFLVAAVGGVTLLRNIGVLGALYNVLLYGVVSYHGYVLAPVRREPTRRTIWIFILGLAFVEMLVHVPASVLDWNIEQYRVSGSSMEPLLRTGDRVLVARVAPNEIKRGDVVVFTRTENPAGQWAKRVLAVGGESVEIREGLFNVSGRLLDDPHFGAFQYLDERDYVSSGKVIHVPLGFLFVVGDNPARSVDSRHFGPVSMGNVVGIPYKIFWPIDRIQAIQPMAERVVTTW